MDFYKLKRKDLQELCKKHNLRANRTNGEMARDLTSLLKKPELEAKPLENLDGSDEIKKVKRVRFCIAGEEEEDVGSVSLKKNDDGNVLRGRRKSFLKPGFERCNQNVEEMGSTKDSKVQKKRTRKSAEVEMPPLSSAEEMKTRRGKKTTESGDGRSRSNVNEEIHIEVPQTRSLRNREIHLNVDDGDLEKRSGGARNAKSKVSEEKKIEAEVREVSVLSKSIRHTVSRKKASEKEAGMGSLSCDDAAIDTQHVKEKPEIVAKPEDNAPRRSNRNASKNENSVVYYEKSECLLKEKVAGSKLLLVHEEFKKDVKPEKAPRKTTESGDAHFRTSVNEEDHIGVPKTRSLRNREILLNVDDGDHEKRTSGARIVKRKVTEAKKMEAEVRNVSVLSKSTRQTRSTKKASGKEAGMGSLSCGDATIGTQHVKDKPNNVAKPEDNAPRRSNRNTSKKENSDVCYEKSECLLKEKVAGSEMLVGDEDFKRDVQPENAPRKSRTAAKRKSVALSNVMAEKPARRCRQKLTNGKQMASSSVAGGDEEDGEKTKPRKQEGNGKPKTGVLVPTSYSELEEIPRRSTRTRCQTIALDSRLEVSAVPNIVVDRKDFLPKDGDEAAMLKMEVVATGGTEGTQPQAKKSYGKGRQKKSLSKRAELKRDTRVDIEVSNLCLSSIKDNEEVVPDTEANDLVMEGYVESDVHVIATLGVSSTVQEAQATVDVPMIVTETCIVSENASLIGVQEVHADVVPIVAETFDIAQETRHTVLEEASLVGDVTALGSSGGPNPESNIDATDGPVKLLENAEDESQKGDAKENIFTFLEDFRYQEKEERVDEQFTGIESSGADHTKELVEISVIDELSETQYTSAIEQSGECSQANLSMEHAPNKFPLCDSTRKLNEGSVLNCTKSAVRSTEVIVAAETKDRLAPAFEYPQETSSKKSTLPSVSGNQDESVEGETQLSVNFDSEDVDAESSMVMGQENLVEESAEVRLQHCKSYTLKHNVSYKVDENKEAVEALAEKSGEERREEASSQETQELLTQNQTSEYHCDSGNTDRVGKNKEEVADDDAECTTILGINFDYKDNENAAENDNEGTLPDIQESFEGKETETLQKSPELMFTGHSCLSSNGVLGGHGRASAFSKHLCSKVVEEKTMLESISGCKYGGNVVNDETQSASAHSEADIRSNVDGEENLAFCIKVADLKKEAVSETHGSFSVDSNEDIITSDDVVEKTSDCAVGKDIAVEDYVEASPLLPTYSPGDENDEDSFANYCKTIDIENNANILAKGEDAECLQQVVLDQDKNALSVMQNNFISVSEKDEPIVEAVAEVTSDCIFTGCMVDKIKPGTSPLLHGSGPSVVEGNNFKNNAGSVEEGTDAESPQQAFEGLVEQMNFELQEMHSVETDKQTFRLDGCLNGEDVQTYWLGDEHDENLGTSLLSTYIPCNPELENGEAVSSDSKSGKRVAYEENVGTPPDSPSNFSLTNVDTAATFEETCGSYNANRCDSVGGVEDVGPSQEVREELSKLKNGCDPSSSIFSEQNLINDGYVDGDAVSSDRKSAEIDVEEKEKAGSLPVIQSYKLNSDVDAARSGEDSDFVANGDLVEKTRDEDSFELVLDEHAYLEKGAVGAKLDCKKLKDAVNQGANEWASSSQVSFMELVDREGLKEEVGTVLLPEKTAEKFDDCCDDREEVALTLCKKRRDTDSLELLSSQHTYLRRDSIPKIQCSEFKFTEDKLCEMKTLTTEIPVVHDVKGIFKDELGAKEFIQDASLEPGNKETGEGNKIEDADSEINVDSVDDAENEVALKESHLFVNGEAKEWASLQVSCVDLVDHQDLEEKITGVDAARLQELTSEYSDMCVREDVEKQDTLLLFEKSGEKLDDHIDEVTALTSSEILVDQVEDTAHGSSQQVLGDQLDDHSDEVTALTSSEIMVDQVEDIAHGSSQQVLGDLCNEQNHMVFEGENTNYCDESSLDKIIYQSCEVEKENASINNRYPAEHETLGCSDVPLNNVVLCQGDEGTNSNFELSAWEISQNEEVALIQTKISGEILEERDTSEAIVDEIVEGSKLEDKDYSGNPGASIPPFVQGDSNENDGLQTKLVLSPEGSNDSNPILNMTDEVQVSMDLSSKRLSAVEKADMPGTMSVSTPKNDSGKDMMDEINCKLSRMYISSARKGRRFGDSIRRTPVRLSGRLQPGLLGSWMKENVQIMKTEPLASRPVEKSVTKRRPLEDLQNISTLI